MNSPHRPLARQPASQRGATLIFTLLALVALLLSSLALVRSVDIGALLMGNLGFKQDATASGDQATRAAVDWLTTNLATLNDDIAASGYYASTREATATVDATGTHYANAATATRNARQLIDWNDDGCDYADSGSYASCDITPAQLSGDINGNTASYVIFRMCDKVGDPGTDSTINCIRPPGSTGGSASVKGDLSYAEPTRFKFGAGPYYRIVVRVQGARNTVSYTETVVHF